MKRNRNHAALCLLLTLCLAFFASCGAGEDKDSPQMSQYATVRKEEKDVPEPEGKNAGWHLLGRQFYQGEAVQIWGVDADSLIDIYLYREDGSGELLLGNAPMEYHTNWYLNGEGGSYLFGVDLLIRLDEEGNELYRQKGNNVVDLCQLQDGKVMALVQKQDRSLSLAEVDPDTGRISEKDKADLGHGAARYISAGQDGLLLMDADGIWEFSPEDGSRENVLPFRGTYDPGPAASDFMLREDGTALVLQRSGKLQSLQLFDPAKDRDIILIRDMSFSEDMKKYIEMFNENSRTYFVAAEEMDEEDFTPIPTDDGTSFTADFSKFWDETTMQIAAGKGADIIGSGAIFNPWDLAENGVFEDLAPYMEKDGIHTEDYFPAAFSSLKDDSKIYGIATSARLGDVWIDAALLEGNEEGEVEKLVEALLNYEGDAVFFDKGGEAETLLGYFFGGSESLWGMVDWENGACDFSGELFAGILEASKRYGYDTAKKEFPAVAGRLGGMDYSFYCYDYYTAREKDKGRVNIGFLSEKGNCATVMPNDLWAISSASAHKEGAWEFIRFLLSEEVLEAENLDSRRDGVYPLNKVCFDQYGARAIAEGSLIQRDDMRIFMVSNEVREALGSFDYMAVCDPTEERVAKIKTMLEADEPSSSFRTSEIRSIIEEEAGAYFAGDKSIEEVAAIVQNRVQLYIDEHR